MANEKIFIVDDEEHILELLRFNFENSGYKVETATNGAEALQKIKADPPKLILLDLMLPGMDGYDVCKEIRKESTTQNIPIIMTTAKSEELDKILGLELGADDYITKPFSIRELLARVKAVLRRTNSSIVPEKVFNAYNISVDFAKREVLNDGSRVDLTLKEFELLETLIKNRGNVLPREILLDKVWGYDYIGESRTVDVHIRHLRKKIEEDDKNPKLIETIRGIGYRFFSGD